VVWKSSQQIWADATTPISRYQQQFTEHAIPSGVLNMAADTGKIPLLKEMAQKAVNSGQPILDWNDFIPVYAKTPCVGVHSVAGAVSCTQDTPAGISQGFAKICKSA
jgi:hypothetical protein